VRAGPPAKVVHPRAMELPAPRTFGFALDRGVATLTLDRPERLNALTFESYRELAETFEQLDRFDEVRAVVLRGNGRGFCSGGDQDDIIHHLLGRSTAELWPSPAPPAG
jgi:enoyl-CoA hydratase/carnithine racemase